MKYKITHVGKRLGQRQATNLLDYLFASPLRLFTSPAFSLLFLMLLWWCHYDYLNRQALASNTVVPEQISPHPR